MACGTAERSLAKELQCSIPVGVMPTSASPQPGPLSRAPSLSFSRSLSFSPSPNVKMNTLMMLEFVGIH